MAHFGVEIWVGGEGKEGYRDGGEGWREGEDGAGLVSFAFAGPVDVFAEGVEDAAEALCVLISLVSFPP
jgi:hypothetical protein